jgi:hypothetical protein
MWNYNGFERLFLKFLKEIDWSVVSGNQNLVSRKEEVQYKMSDIKGGRIAYPRTDAVFSGDF